MLDIENLALKELSKIASEQYGIENIADDGNIKTLQLLIVLGLRAIPSRQGQDAYDSFGNFFQLKTATRIVVSTSHHLSNSILWVYRAANYWVFGIFSKGSYKLEEVYIVLTSRLEPWFAGQEEKLLRENKDFLNDPKIKLSLVREIGLKLDLTTIKDKSTKEILAMVELNEDERLKDLLMETANQILERREKKSDQLNNLQKELNQQKQLNAVFISEMGKYLHSSIVEAALSKALASVGPSASVITAAASSTVSQALVNTTNISTSQASSSIVVEPSVVTTEDDEEAKMTKFLTSEYFVRSPTNGAPGDVAKSVTGHIITRYYRIWHQKTYGSPAPKQRNAQTSNKVFKNLGLMRKNDRIFGLEQKLFQPKAAR